MPVWKDVDESQLLKAAKSGETEAFGEIYERYAKLIFKYLYSQLSSREDAEDLTEDVFLRVWDSLGRYQDKGFPFSAYLFRIARNALIDHYRRSKNSELPIEDMQIVANSNPAEKATSNLVHEELREVLDQLKDDYRDVLILRFLSELSPAETAQIMDRSVGAIRVLQHRAIGAMRDLLNSSQRKLR